MSAMCSRWSARNNRRGYNRVQKIDGVRRMIIMGILVIPNEFALYDIIQEHFGPDAVPR